MKKRLTILSIIIMVISLMSYTNVIYWDQRRLLTWDDFKSVPGSQVYEDGGGAATAYMITRSRSEIHAAMDQNKSWSLKREQTDDALKHEQGHFDIAEVYARKLRKAVSDFVFEDASFNLQYDSLYRYYFNACESEQLLYDTETDHHRNEGAQKGWNVKIQKELDDYETYSNPKIKIKRHL